MEINWSRYAFFVGMDLLIRQVCGSDAMWVFVAITTAAWAAWQGHRLLQESKQ